jgi:hypothetical protein
MTVQRLTLAGWLAITYAVLAIPFFALSAALSSLSGDEVKIANLLLLLVIFALAIFPILGLKKLLNTVPCRRLIASGLECLYPIL